MRAFITFSALCVCAFGVAQVASRGPWSPHMLTDRMYEDEIAYYLVIERINMNFGSRVTTYRVDDLKYVSTVNLGANNTRTIIPKYAKPKPKRPPVYVAGTPGLSRSAVTFDRPKILTETPVIKVKVEEPAAKPMTVDIDLLATYERVLEKGYVSVDMLKRVANGRFFEGNLTLAAKWYDKLFDQTNDLEPVFYYRYSRSLQSVGQAKKAEAMMKLFKERDN